MKIYKHINLDDSGQRYAIYEVDSQTSEERIVTDKCVDYLAFAVPPWGHGQNVPEVLPFNPENMALAREARQSQRRKQYESITDKIAMEALGYLLEGKEDELDTVKATLIEKKNAVRNKFPDPE